MLLRFGIAVECADGRCGDLADIVFLPGTRRVTHVVVAPRHHHTQARLVPFDLIADPEVDEPEIRLGCTVADVHALPAVQEFAYVRLAESPPLESDNDAVGIQEVLTVPSQGYGSFQIEPWANDQRVAVTYDRIPRGEVEVRSATEISAVGGERIGQLDGLIVDDLGTITAAVLERGHLWGRRRITIPAAAVARFEMDRLTLALSKSEIDELVPSR